MEVYQTDEQQLEGIRRWFKENANRIFWAIILVSAVIGSIKYYFHHQAVLQEQASDRFNMMMSSYAQQDKITGEKEALQLIEGYPKTPYAALGALMLAKQAVEEQKFEEAQKQLQWVVSHTSQSDIKIIAAIRLARVYLAQKKWDETEKLFAEAKANGYLSLLAEVEGDYYFLKQDLVKARAAYKTAVDADPNKSERRPLLRMKLEELGVG